MAIPRVQRIQDQVCRSPCLVRMWQLQLSQNFRGGLFQFQGARQIRVVHDKHGRHGPVELKTLPTVGLFVVLRHTRFRSQVAARGAGLPSQRLPPHPTDPCLIGVGSLVRECLGALACRFLVVPRRLPRLVDLLLRLLRGRVGRGARSTRRRFDGNQGESHGPNWKCSGLRR